MNFLKFKFKNYPFQIIYFLIAISLSFFSINSKANSNKNWNYQIVINDESELTKQIVNSIKQKIPSATVINSNPSSNENTLSIAIGSGALRSLLSQKNNGLIISVFTSSITYRDIVKTAKEFKSGTMTAIYAEPSPLIQFQLISKLFKRPVNVLFLKSDRTSYYEPLLRKAAEQTNNTLIIEDVNSDESIYKTLKRHSDSQVLLAVPDATIFNNQNIGDILMTTYKREQGLIGFSAKMVQVGALASSYSGIEDITEQIKEMIHLFEESGKLPAPQFPKYFTVSVNKSVARSLNIIVDAQVENFKNIPKAGDSK